MDLSGARKSGNARPKLAKVSDDMKAWSAALTTEFEAWPQVEARPFFGFTALYRRKQIFALLPRTRAMKTPNSLAFKLEAPTPSTLTKLRRDPRISATEMQRSRWFTFELTTASDLRDTLRWLGRAHEGAGKKAKDSRGSQRFLMGITFPVSCVRTNVRITLAALMASPSPTVRVSPRRHR